MTSSAVCMHAAKHVACICISAGPPAPPPHLQSCSGRETPSVACAVQPGAPGGFQKVFFGSEEVAIPVFGR